MIDVRGLTWEQWASQTTTLISQYGTIPKPGPVSHWREWARTVCAFPTMAQNGVPWPTGFRDWDDWARLFNLQMRLTGN